jgi:hypothetical protein
MPTVDNLDIQISTSLKNTDIMLDNLIKKLGVVSSSLSRVGGTTSTVSSGMTRVAISATRSTKSFKGLSSAIGMFYAKYFLYIRAIKGLYKSIVSTADYIEAFNYFEVSFNKIANDWKRDFSKYGYNNAEEYAESFNKRAKESLSKLSGVQIDIDSDRKGLLTETGMKNLGLNIQDITQYASQLASVTNSIGQTGEVSLATANAFTKLAGDISSLFNQDYSAVAKNLQSGLIGQSRALYKYGIDITNATLQTYAYNLGIEKNVSEMTQAEKMQLRMIAILNQSKVSWGDLANTINSPSNMIRQFKNNLKEAGMMLGQLFIPLLQKVLPVINGVTIAIKNLLGNIAGILGIKLDLSSFGQTGTDLEDSYGDLSDSLDDVAESAKKAKAGIRAFDELKTINETKNSSDGLGNTIDLTNEIIKATEEYEKVWQEAYEKMENRAQKFADSISKYFKPIEKLFQDIKIGDWFAVGQDVSNIATGILDYFTRAIENVDWEQVGTNIGLFLAGIDWSDIMTSAFNLYRSLKEALIDVVRNSFEEAPMETFLIIAGIILRRLGGAIALKTLTMSLSSIIISGIGKIALNSWISKHFTSQVAGLLPGATASNPITLSSVVLSISGFLLSPIGVGTPAFDILSEKLLGGISEKVKEKLPKWSIDFFDDLGGGIALGALAGSWIPGIGTAAGAIVGGIIGTLEGIEIDGKSLFNTIFSPLFNFDYSIGIFKLAGDFFKDVKTSFENRDWLSVGSNILQGIGNGIYGALYFLIEPIADLFYFIYDGICDIFGIESPAKEMKPLGKNILLGVAEGFSESFEEMRKKIKSFFSNLVRWWEKNKPNLSEIKLNVKTPKISVEWETKSATAQVLQKLGLKGLPDFDVKWFQTGGYIPSTFSLIGAGENGIPEILGSVGGRPAIAGGAEITGIRDEIRATANEEIQLLKQQNALLQAILNKEFGITDSDIGKSAQRYARDYFNRTGNEAYTF